jgi:hypothetical protein
MAAFLNNQEARYQKEQKEFVIGWFGILGGFSLFFFGLLGRHIVRYRDYASLPMEGKSFTDIWSLYGASISDITSFVMAIGRIVYFVSSVAALFTYQGKQIWKWTLICVGGLMLIGSGLGSMLKHHSAVVSIAVSGLGSIGVIAGVAVVDVGNGYKLAKATVMLAVLLGAASFPSGILFVSHGLTFSVCMITEGASFIVGFVSLILFLQRRLTPQASHID